MNGILEEEQAGVRQTGPAQPGCHAPDASANVQAVLEGVPGNYTLMPGGGEYAPQEFNLSVRIEGGPGGDVGGFNLWASGGTLAAAQGEEDRLRLSEDSDEATHTTDGRTGRSWNLTWTSPEEPDESVVFQLIVNAIDPDSQAPSPTDEWNRDTRVSAGDSGVQVAGEEHAVRVEEIGVGWFAYWVGIISFAFLIVILLVYFVVFRYGETSKATDHRSRKGKSK